MSETITALTVLFVAASAMLLLFHRLAHPAIPAYILAGVVAGFLIEEDALLAIAQLGITFLVFLFGIRTEWRPIHRIGRTVLTTVIVQIGVLVGAALGIGVLLGLDTLNMLYLGAAAALSSSLVGLGFVDTDLHMDLLHGRLSAAINLVQDVVAILILVAATTTPFAIGPVGRHVAIAAAFLVTAGLLRDTLAPPFLDAVAGSRELLMLTVMTVLIAAMVAADAAGITPIVGAFAAGLAVGRKPHRLEISDVMEPLKDFFAAVFFVVIGALVVLDPEALFLALILTGITLLVKPALITFLIVENGYDSRTAFLTAMGLDHVSEFALIIAIQAFIADAIAPAVFHAITLAAVVTMVASAYTTRHADRIYTWLREHRLIHSRSRKLEAMSDLETDLTDHIVLVGYGVQGKLIAEDLRRQDEQFVVIENDPEQADAVLRDGGHVVLGNALNQRPWNRCGAREAKLIISTIPDPTVSRHILALDTDADVVLRAENPHDAEELVDRGATYVDVPDLMAADRLREILEGVLQSDTYAEELRDRNLEELQNYEFAGKQ